MFKELDEFVCARVDEEIGIDPAQYSVAKLHGDTVIRVTIPVALTDYGKAAAKEELRMMVKI